MLEYLAMLVSVGAAVLSALALWTSHRSASAAERAADESRRSADAADDAVSLQEEERLRSIERSDVALEFKRMGGTFVVTNLGTTRACSVQYAATINGERLTGQAGDRDGGETLVIDFQAIYGEASRADSEATRRMREAGYVWASGGPKLRYEVRVTWVTPLGTPGVAAFTSPRKSRTTS